MPVLAVVLGSMGVTAGAQAAASASTVETVTVTTSSCVAHWSVPASGVATFSVANRSTIAVDAELTVRDSGDIVGDVRILGPGTERTVGVRLRRGTYQWVCVYDHLQTLHSASRRVSVGVPKSGATPELIPTTAAEMAGPQSAYDAYVTGQLQTLQTQVAALATDIAQGNVTQAKSDWLPAELTYSAIGGLYGNIGPLQDEINGLAAGHPGGETTTTWHGLHKIEYLLWHGRPAATVAPYAAALGSDVQQLAVLWSSEHPLTANLLSTRAHEILEDTQRDVLSGDDDYGSGTSLAQATADLQGDQVVLGDLKGLLDQRAPRLLPVAEPELHSLAQAIQSTKVNGQWVPLSALTPTERETINADIGQVLETLAPIPDLLEVQRFADDPGAG